MPEPTTLGTWLRRERERRGVTLSQISEDTKVSVPLLEGLEADDLSRWPGGIFRRSFARSYAAAIGLDGDLVVKRIEEEHPDPTAIEEPVDKHAPKVAAAPAQGPARAVHATPVPAAAWRAPFASRLMAVALDLLVAAAIAFGFAAGGSRLLWPVIVIAAYHALGVLLAGTTPMLAMIAVQREQNIVTQPAAAVPPPAPAEAARRPEPQQSRRRRGRRAPARAEAARLDRTA